MALAIAIATLLNTAAPGIAQLAAILFVHTDGTVSIVPILNDASANLGTDVQKAVDWIKAHPSK